MKPKKKKPAPTCGVVVDGDACGGVTTYARAVVAPDQTIFYSYCAKHKHLGKVSAELIDRENAKGRETYIAEVINSARTVQDFLWGDIGERDYSFELWLEILAKRIDKIRNIQKSNPHADVELRKRLLQTAAVAVAWMQALPGETE